MELKRIKFVSAFYFGVVALVVQLITGISQLILYKSNPGLFSSNGLPAPSAVFSLIVTPVIVGVLFYVFMLLLIWIYNQVARKFPISWEVRR